MWQLGHGKQNEANMSNKNSHQRHRTSKDLELLVTYTFITTACDVSLYRAAFWLRAPPDCDPVMKAVGEDMDFQLQLLDEVPEADMADS